MIIFLKNGQAATFFLWPAGSPVESGTSQLIGVDFFTLVFRWHDFKADISKKVYKYRLD